MAIELPMRGGRIPLWVGLTDEEKRNQGKSFQERHAGRRARSVNGRDRARAFTKIGLGPKQNTPCCECLCHSGLVEQLMWLSGRYSVQMGSNCAKHGMQGEAVPKWLLGTRNSGIE